MPDLATIYAPAFFAEWGPSNAPYVRSAEVSVEVIYEAFQPRRLVDLGCGCGVYSHLFAERGVEVVAVDGVRPPPDHAYDVPIYLRDLTEPFENVWGDFDLTLCLEVAEHIPESLVEPFLENATPLW
jgi:2-polyprenyl-3-methyl-5-hydroxy-6-metoxy-1,4-benzoquinol methylase